MLPSFYIFSRPPPLKKGLKPFYPHPPAEQLSPFFVPEISVE
jgi:hypothetical protein